MNERRRVRERQGDYRARATGGVALVYLVLLLPFALYALSRGFYVIAAGGAFIIALLAASTWLVAHGRDHEPLTLFGLVPGGILFMALIFRIDGDVASAWCFPSVLACYCMLSVRRAHLANAAILIVAVPMLWLELAPLAAARFTACLTAVSLFASILVREIDAQQKRLKYQLDHDPLTGLLNRSSLEGRLQGAIEAFRLVHAPAAALALDLDRFKDINDRFGHETGDLVLCEVARRLRVEIGESGAVFRLGGEEFLVLLQDREASAAERWAETLRVAIADATILQGRSVTVSIGIAKLRMSDDRTSWTRRADDRLYRAKREGRDRVVSADGGGELGEEDPALAPAFD